MIQINETQVFTTLRTLNITYDENSINSKRDMHVLCPYHNDTNFGSAFINISNGLFHCFACAKSNSKIGKNLIDIVRDTRNLSYKQALKFIGLKQTDQFESKLGQIRKDKVENQKKKEKLQSTSIDDLQLENFDPAEYRYTSERGYTIEFLKRYGIKKCVSGWYKDYFIIPIRDRKKGIDTFEARKLTQHESICDFLEIPSKTRSDRAKSRFTAFIKENSISALRGKDSVNKVKIDGETHEIPELWYLLKPKVLYPANSKVDQTLFDIDNLDLEKDIYISEGSGSLPKMSHQYDNITCLFGASITKAQLKLLSKFKGRKIYLPDNDEASENMLYDIGQNLEDCYVLPIESDDTDLDFLTELKEVKPVSAVKYVVEKIGYYKAV